jgi:hypothetical protein
MPQSYFRVQSNQNFANGETEPLIVEANGQRVMVYVTENDTRDGRNRPMLMYSLYNASTGEWSAPSAVHDDGTADFFPNIASDGTNVWVAWHNSNTTFGSNATSSDMLGAAEITVARFNGTTFTDVTTLTDSSIMDTRPKIAVNGDEVFIAWVQNPRNDLFGTGGFDNSIMARQFTGGAWSEPVTISSGLGAVVDMDLAYFNGRFQVAYVTSGDNDPESFDALSLIMRDLTGSVTATPVSGNLALSPKFATINGQQVLSWYERETIALDGESVEGGNIRYTTANGQIQSLFDIPNMPMVNYQIYSNNAGDTAVLYPFFLGGNGFIIARLQENGIWGSPFVLTETEGFAWFFDGVWEDDGEFNLVFNNSQIVEIGGNFVEINNLQALMAAPPTNIMLTNALYFPEDIRLGESLPVMINVTNIGIPVSGISLMVDDVQIGTYSGLLTGESATIEFDLQIPVDMSAQTDFVIKVEPIGQTGVDMNNNTYTMTLGHTNLALSLSRGNLDNDSVVVLANVVNDSDYAASATLYVRRGASDGTVIDYVELGAIAGRETVFSEFNYDPKTLIPEGEDFEVLYFEIVSDVEELFTADNSAFVVIRSPTADPLPPINWPQSPGGSSSSRWDNGRHREVVTTPAPAAPVSSFGNQTLAVAAVNTAVQQARANNQSFAVVRCTNPSVSGISLATMRAMANAAGGFPVRTHADTLNANRTEVDVRITFNPANATKDILLLGSTTSLAAVRIRNLFEHHFGGTMMAVSLAHQGSFGMDVRVAVRLAPNLDSSSLLFYRYDRTANTYRQFMPSFVWLDNNGFIHFNTGIGGDIVLTNAKLPSTQASNDAASTTTGSANTERSFIAGDMSLRITTGSDSDGGQSKNRGSGNTNPQGNTDMAMTSSILVSSTRRRWKPYD